MQGSRKSPNSTTASKSTKQTQERELESAAEVPEPPISPISRADVDYHVAKLPPQIDLFLREKVRQYVVQIVEGHPLSARLTPTATQLAVDEVVPSVMETAITAFIAHLSNQNNAEVKLVLGVNTFSEDLLNNNEVVILLQDAANNVVRLSTGTFISD